jgi:hypothetical protein
MIYGLPSAGAAQTARSFEGEIGRITWPAESHCCLRRAVNLKPRLGGTNQCREEANGEDHRSALRRMNTTICASHAAAL